MLNVEQIKLHDAEKAVAFIRKIQADAEPEFEILSRSVLIKKDDDIVGMVSYESHDGSVGIIRYFLYDTRVTGTDVMIRMFFELYKQAHEKGVKKLIAQIPSQDVANLFQMLGFVKIENDDLKLSGIVKPNVDLMLINL